MSEAYATGGLSFLQVWRSQPAQPMPDPIAIVSATKFLWTESKPIRNWLWSKLPFARDQIKREIAENELANLLEDSNKLARSLTPEQADEAIDKRIEVFRVQLVKAKIPEDQAEILVERGALFVKLLVTGPLGETAILQERVTEMEKAGQEAERTLERLRSGLPSKDDFHRIELHIHRLHVQLVIAWGVAGTALLLAAIGIAIALKAR